MCATYMSNYVFLIDLSIDEYVVNMSNKIWPAHVGGAERDTKNALEVSRS